ncbi:gamma-glutamyltransferase [Ruicaihuangia caeni]|uniref:gamma-glutamyltransferase n=1 Tax=Ruicaihuangia caeni TaxID=3042517 RepID=UPI00338D623A
MHAGTRGAVSAAHPLAVEAALDMLEAGGCAIDAATAAQAVICAVMPHSAGLGGDLLQTVRLPTGSEHSLNATGRSARSMPSPPSSDGGTSVTVPGVVSGWEVAQRRWGRLPLSAVLEPALRAAKEGYRVDAILHRSAQDQRRRLERFGGGDWGLLHLEPGDLWRQPELASLIEAIGKEGSTAFYQGSAARAVAESVSAHGGSLDETDLARHSIDVTPPVTTAWRGGRLAVQPPNSQGVLLAMAARWFEQRGVVPDEALDHLLVEVTEAVFAHRDNAGRGSALFDETLEVDETTAARRGGPRAYLHTAGVAVVDSDGYAVSSLVSVFDDFGSAVFVPELGISLNNRAAGFTQGSNAPRPNARPVHTLAPALITDATGRTTALATPGADGQVQTLLQVMCRMRFLGQSLAEAIAAPRWRSENGLLLIEAGHPRLDALTEQGHPCTVREPGDGVFGAVVAAGFDDEGPFAEADWRRQVKRGKR